MCLRRRNRWCVVRVSGALALTASVSQWAGAVVFDIHELAYFEDPVPGATGQFAYFQDLTLLDNGDLYFKGSTSGPPFTNKGLFKGSTGMPVSAVAVIGEAEFPTGFVPANRYDVNQSGVTVFDYVSSNTKLYKNAGGGASDLITDTSTNQTIGGHTGRFGGSIDRLDLNETGRFAFVTDFGSTTATPIVKGLFTATGNSDIANVVWEDDAAPGIAGALFTDSFSNLTIGVGGDVYFSAIVDGGTVTDSNNNTFWRNSGGGTTLLAARATRRRGSWIGRGGRTLCLIPVAAAL